MSTSHLLEAFSEQGERFLLVGTHRHYFPPVNLGTTPEEDYGGEAER